MDLGVARQIQTIWTQFEYGTQFYQYLLETFISIMAVGVHIRYPLRHKSQVRKITPLIHFVVCLLLFLLGLSIGLNRLIIDNLGYFCGQAAVISSLSILGSMMDSLAVYHIFFKGNGASGEKSVSYTHLDVYKRQAQSIYLRRVSINQLQLPE